MIRYKYFHVIDKKNRFWHDFPFLIAAFQRSKFLYIVSFAETLEEAESKLSEVERQNQSDLDGRWTEEKLSFRLSKAKLTKSVN